MDIDVGWDVITEDDFKTIEMDILKEVTGKNGKIKNKYNQCYKCPYENKHCKTKMFWFYCGKSSNIDKLCDIEGKIYNELYRKNKNKPKYKDFGISYWDFYNNKKGWNIGLNEDGWNWIKSNGFIDFIDENFDYVYIGECRYIFYDKSE